MTSDLTTKAAETLAGLARKLSDALLTVCPLGGSDLFMRVGEDFYADPSVCSAEIAKLRSDLHEAKASVVRGSLERNGLVSIERISPTHFRYRITEAGIAALAPLGEE